MKDCCLGACKTFSNQITKVQILLQNRPAQLFWICQCCMHFTLALNSVAQKYRQDGQANVTNKLMIGNINCLNPLFLPFSSIIPVSLTPDFGLEMKRSLLCGSVSSSRIFYIFPPTCVARICCSFQETGHGKKPRNSDDMQSGNEEKQPVQNDQYTPGYRIFNEAASSKEESALFSPAHESTLIGRE